MSYLVFRLQFQVLIYRSIVGHHKIYGMDIVTKTGLNGRLFRGRPSSQLVSPIYYDYLLPGLRQIGACGQTVGASPDDDHIAFDLRGFDLIYRMRI